jgi:polyisoprenyl-phosphate glycosyltransferase
MVGQSEVSTAVRAPLAETGGWRTLSIVVPVYFNSQSLPLFAKEVESFEKELEARQFRLELIFVNDGSTDESLAELVKIKEARPATKLISLARNFGAVAASKTGFKYVTGDVFTILSADLQDPIDQFLPMLEHWRAGAKFVVAARATRKDPPLTMLFAALYYRLIDWMVVKNYPKGGFDLMMMDKALLPYMANSTSNTNPNMYAFWLGFKPIILPYHRGERRYGKSRWTFRKKLRFLLNTVTGFSVAPLRIMSGFGILAALASFMYGIWIVANALIFGVGVAGFATLAALISFFSGMILVMLGIVGEYLWRIFDAVSKKPESVIDTVYL